MSKYLDKTGLQTFWNSIKNRLFTNENLMVDHVIERGSSGNWVWEKYDSGIVKLWGSFTHSFNITDAWGDFYTAENGTTCETFPSGLFATTPSFCNITNTSGTWTLSLTMAPSCNASHTQYYFPTRATSGSVSNGKYLVYAIGMWK